MKDNQRSLTRLESKPRHFPGLIKVGVSVTVLGTLGVFLFPSFMAVQEYSRLEKNLHNAKSIYLGLKMYAGDHDGHFPNKTTEGKPLANANEAFRYLVPTYIPAKSVFYSKSSPWTPNPPDDRIIPGKTPMAGENHFAYVTNLTDTENPNFPIVATGFAKGTPGIYAPKYLEKIPGSERLVAAIVRVDGSGMMETVPNEDQRVYIPYNQGKEIDIFKPAPGWLRPDQAPLNPEE